MEIIKKYRYSSSIYSGSVSTLQTPIKTRGSVCKVRTQDPENLDEEVKSLVTAWRVGDPDLRSQAAKDLD